MKENRFLTFEDLEYETFDEEMFTRNYNYSIKQYGQLYEYYDYKLNDYLNHMRKDYSIDYQKRKNLETINYMCENFNTYLNNVLLTDELMDILKENKQLQDLFFSSNKDDFEIAIILLEEQTEIIYSE